MGLGTSLCGCVCASVRDSGVLGCFYCLSLWISLPVAFLLGADWLSGFFFDQRYLPAIITQRITDRRSDNVPPAQYSEDSENVLLRPTETTTPTDPNSPAV